MARLSPDVRDELRLFAFYLANGTLDMDILGDEWDYQAIFEEPSVLEMAFAIWAHKLEIDDEGAVTNGAQAQRRAAQYIRRFVDPEYVVDPPFGSEETAL